MPRMNDNPAASIAFWFIAGDHARISHQGDIRKSMSGNEGFDHRQQRLVSAVLPSNAWRTSGKPPDR
jgi:hypothetical protein